VIYVERFRLVVPGKPVPWSRPEDNRYGGKRNKEAHEAQMKLIRQMWQLAGSPVIGEGAIVMGLTFHFKRPKSHFLTSKKSAGKLTKAAPRQHTQIPDTSNLVKLVEDALGKDHAYHDDAQIIGHSPSPFKWWRDEDETLIEVQRYSTWLNGGQYHG